MSRGLDRAAEMRRTGELVVRGAATLLQGADDERLQQLVPRVPAVDSRPWSVVLTGPYNAGKSSIAFALTGDESIVIDSDVATATTERYPWKSGSTSIEVVDTPGVRTGDTTHDEIAETALRNADLVLFVVTTSLFDDTIAAYLRHVALELGKLEQLVVVVNKAAQQPGTPEIRERAVREALDNESVELPLVVACDARSALEALGTDDPDVRELATRRSNWTGFEDTIGEFIHTRGDAGRLRKPLEAVIAVATDADELLRPSETELAAVDLLARQRQGMAHSRERLSGRFEDVFHRLNQSIANAGEKVVSSARDGVPQAKAVDEFDKAVALIASGIGDKLQTALGEEVVALEADGHRLAQGPEAIRLAEALKASPDALFTRQRFNDAPGALNELLKSFAAGQGKEFLGKLVGGGARPGSPMHDLVGRIGHAFKKKFEAGEIVRWSKRINIALQAAAVLFEFGKAVDAAMKQDQEQQAAIAELRSSVLDVSEDLIAAARIDVAPLVADFYGRLAQPLDEVEAELNAVQAERDRIASGLRDLSRQARRALSDAPVEERE